MEVNPNSVAEHFAMLVKSQNPGAMESPPSEKEKLIAEELVKSLNQLMVDSYFEEDESLLFEENPNSEHSNFSQQLLVDDHGRQVTDHSSGVTLQRKEAILKIVESHPTWSIQTLKKHGAPELLYKNYIARWEKQVRRGGTRFDQWKFVDEYTFAKYQEAREDLKEIHGSNLRLWGLQGAHQLRDPSFNFRASQTWIDNFKLKHGIASRKITKLVSKKETLNMESILAAATDFQRCIKEEAKKFPPRLVINADQCGFIYELTGNRTLSTVGEKITVVSSKSPHNLGTHSYTAVYTISLDGTLVGDVYLCFQEQSGRFGEFVKQNLFPACNVTVTCSKSGKLTTSLHEYYLDEVILKSVHEDFMFIVDSWSGQTNESSYVQRFGGENQVNCELKVIPKNCTSFCQPLDTTFHRQLKYFARKLYLETKMNYNVDLNPADEITTRNNLVRMHSLLGNQLSAESFKPMIRYCWYSAGLTDDKIPFKSVKENCFDFEHGETLICSVQECENPRFIKCARCRTVLCFPCFFYEYHYHY